MNNNLKFDVKKKERYGAHYKCYCGKFQVDENLTLYYETWKDGDYWRTEVKSNPVSTSVYYECEDLAEDLEAAMENIDYFVSLVLKNPQEYYD